MVFSIGVLLIPVLPYIVKGELPNNINLYALFVVYLLNTCLTYWLFAYKTAILTANQREDLPNKVNCIVTLLKYTLQVSLLVCFRNYYIYVIVLPLTTLLVNFGNAYMANRYFPQYQCRGDINKDAKHDIVQKIKALFFNKVGVSIITGSDNIVISTFLGLTVLGIYDSYYYIYSMIYSIFAIVHISITASIGNSVVKESVEKNFDTFNKLTFLNFWVVGWCSVTLFCLYKPFIQIWIGENNSFDTLFSLIMATYLFFWLYRFVVIIFKNVQGMWWKDRYRAISESLLNLSLNIILVKTIGIHGVTLSTLIASIVISLPWEAEVLFRDYFKKTASSYYKNLVKRFAVFVFVGLITFMLCESLQVENRITSFVCRVIICILIPNCILFIIYRKTEEFRFIINYAKRLKQ